MRAAFMALKERREEFRRQMGCCDDQDASGNFWLFGGQGLDSAGTTGLLNDLWEYNSTANQWTWIGPSTSNAANQNGNYGTLGTGSGTTAPGGRQAAVLWADAPAIFGFSVGLDSIRSGLAPLVLRPAGSILNDLLGVLISRPSNGNGFRG